MNPYINLGNQINKAIANSKFSSTHPSVWDSIDESYQKALIYSPDIQSKKLIGRIYDLLDIYFDATQHDFSQIKRKYSLQDAESDLMYAKDILLTGNIEVLLSNQKFINRIINLY